MGGVDATPSDLGKWLHRALSNNFGVVGRYQVKNVHTLGHRKPVQQSEITC